MLIVYSASLGQYTYILQTQQEGVIRPGVFPLYSDPQITLSFD